MQSFRTALRWLLLHLLVAGLLWLHHRLGTPPRPATEALPFLSQGDLNYIRKEMGKAFPDGTWNRPTLQAAVPVITHHMNGACNRVQPVIDAETAPFFFSREEQDTLIALWFEATAIRLKVRLKDGA